MLEWGVRSYLGWDDLNRTSSSLVIYNLTLVGYKYLVLMMFNLSNYK